MSYAQIPEMSAFEVTEKLVAAIRGKDYDFILVNYANPDMVGHTGDFKAAIKALEVVDECAEIIISEVLKKGGCLLITADHGNIEEMINLETGQIDTQHSNNPVPFWYVTPDNKKENPGQGAAGNEVKGLIADIAPTILELLGVDRDEDMVGLSLFDRISKK
jgi:2,3-bisphosphoglycerate-independent phosphoglycerate mutase